MKAIPFFALTLPALLVFGGIASAQKASPNGASAAHKTAKKSSATHKTVRKRLPRGPEVDPTEGDNADGDDLVIRRAAVAALGHQAGTIVVVDPSNGRVLTMVNQ